MTLVRCGDVPVAGVNKAHCTPDVNEASTARCMPASYMRPTPAALAALLSALACDFAAAAASLDFAAYAAAYTSAVN